MPLKDARRVPLATYRLQLHADFNFEATAKRVPYFQALGISDLYCSPIFRAAPGSLHGYDVSDYRKINPELGGGEAFFRLSDLLTQQRMALLLDFVPNHMGIQGPFNAWWRDVLESGPHSPFASYFDIHWNSEGESTPPRVLVPILESHYGKVLEQGKLSIVYLEGALFLAYGEVRFPVSPNSYPLILEKLAQDSRASAASRAALAELIVAFAHLPLPDGIEDPARATSRAQAIEQLKRRLAELIDRTPGLRPLLDERLATLNGFPENPNSFDELDKLIEHQHYRLARWKAGVHEINYRRFFAVDSLVGLRMENPQVFHESHLLLRHLIKDGRVAGLRIDHIDGLWDPLEYLERVQSLGQEETRGAEKPLYVLVEKIRERQEDLPSAWATHGTTGYEFITQIAGIFVDPANETRFAKMYRKFTGDESDYEETIYQKKRLILDELFANAVIVFGNELSELVNCDRRWRDLTRHELVTAVREIMASLKVYRTYRRTGKMDTSDRLVVEDACRRAKERNPRFDPGPVEFVQLVLTGDYPPEGASAEYREALDRWVMRFQQYTGAVMAKSVEDTAFYSYCRFVGLNEVGGDPSIFGGSVAEFHETNRHRLKTTPLALLATSTHDTKVSEDVRARLYTLSEIPAEWEDWVSEWKSLAEPLRTMLEGLAAPDPVDEYRLYQILIGAWLLDTDEPTEEFRKRIREHVRKSVNEAKRFTSWIHPNEPYLQACDRFVDGLLTRPSGDRFLESFVPKAKRVAHLGMVNSLAQLVLKSTVPGVPDFYQGNEVWDFSLVDPDNRRAVDYSRNEALLSEIKTKTPLDLLRGWRDGGIKLWTTQRLLALRAAHPEVFSEGDYFGLNLEGRFKKHALAFCRSHGKVSLAVVVPRISAILGCPPTGLVWDNTSVELGQARGDWEDIFTGCKFPANTALNLIDLLAELPFAVLVNRGEQ
jgi:(1->4)-alpha-D-glucan 1-alpha-D-glucosylmutase